MPENAFTRLPAAKSAVRLSRYATIIPGDYDIYLRVTSCVIICTGPAGALEVGLVVVGFLPVMSRSSAEPTVMPRARSNSAVRPGAVGGESLQPCQPRRDRSARFRALDDCVQDGNEQQTRARSVGNVARPRE